MASGVELASAYVSLVPSFKGGQAAIASQLDGPAEEAGKAAGSKSGLGFASKFVLGLGGLAVAAGVALFAVGNTFDNLSDTIVTTTGKSGQALDDLVASAKNMGKTTPSSFDDIAIAVGTVNQRLGLTGEPLEKISSQFLNLSRITGTDLKTNVANISRVFGDWSISTDKQSKALDTIYRASQLTGVGIDALSTNVVQFGAPLRQMGFSFEQSVAMFAKWEKEGVNTQTVMSGMKIGLGKMAKAGEEPVGTFKRITEEIKKAGSAGAANAIALKAFGQRAGPDMAAAIREGRFELTGLITELSNSEGAISDADQNTRDFAESWQIFKNKVLLIIAPLAAKLFEILSVGMQWLADNVGPIFETLSGILTTKVIPAVKALTEWVKDNWSWIKILAIVIATIFIPHLIALGVQSIISAAKQVIAWILTKGAAVGAAAAHSVAVLAMIAGWIILGVQSLIQAAKVAAAWILAMGPVAWVIAAVIALVALIILNWDKILQITKAVWAAVWGFIKDTASDIASWIQGRIDDVLGFFNMLGALPGRALAWFGGVLRAGQDKLGELISWVRGIPGRILDSLGNLGDLLINAGKAIIRGFLSGLKSAFEDVKTFVSGIGSWISNHKGPIEVDATLLTPHGGAIMDGLLVGLKAEEPALTSYLTELTAGIGNTPLPRAKGLVDVAGSDGASAGIHIEHLQVVFPNALNAMSPAELRRVAVVLRDKIREVERSQS